MAAKRHLTIGLPWGAANSANLGLGALTEANLDLLEEVAAELGLTLDFEILFWADAAEDYITRPNLRTVTFNKKFLAAPKGGMWSYAKRADIVIDIAGGDSFADIYGARRFFFQSATKAATIKAGAPLILAPQTIGPFEKAWARRVGAWICKNAYATVTRDKMSSDFVRELGADATLIECTDVAFRLRYQTIELPPTDKIRVGLNVSGLLFNGGYGGGNALGLSVDYPVMIRRLIRALLARGDVELHLVGHVLRPASNVALEDDHTIAKMLAAEFDDQGDVKVAPLFRSPSEAKSYISALDVFSGSRMHACIAAFSSRVPLIPLAYSRKFKGLFSTLGYTLNADCKADSDDVVIQKVLDGVENRAELATLIPPALDEAAKRLERYKAVLRDAMIKAAGLDAAPASAPQTAPETRAEAESV